VRDITFIIVFLLACSVAQASSSGSITGTGMGIGEDAKKWSIPRSGTVTCLEVW
jgi:hypothetical protein